MNQAQSHQKDSASGPSKWTSLLRRIPFMFWEVFAFLLGPKRLPSRIFLVVLWGLFAYFSSELLLSKLLHGSFWPALSRKPMTWVLSSLLIASCVFGIYALTNRLLFAMVLVGSGLFVVYGSHINKMRILNRALMPWDLLNGREVIALFPTMLTSWTAVFTVLVLLVALLWAFSLLFRKSRYPLRWPVRLVAIVVAISLPLPLLYYRPLKLESTLLRMRITNWIWDHNQNVGNNGLILSLLLNTRSLLVSSPAGYSEKQVWGVLDALDGEAMEAGAGDSPSPLAAAESELEAPESALTGGGPSPDELAQHLGAKKDPSLSDEEARGLNQRDSTQDSPAQNSPTPNSPIQRTRTQNTPTQLGQALPASETALSQSAENSAGGRDLSKREGEVLVGARADLKKGGRGALPGLPSTKERALGAPEGSDGDVVLAQGTLGSAADENWSLENFAPGDVDVVVYMAESFWDPSLFDVPFSRDPMPFIRGLMEEWPSGSLHCPVFGGGTANTEFEVLTGLPVALLPSGSYPYQNYVARPTPSLVSAVKEHGYRAIALHPFHRWYWSRETVYPFLGFDESHFLEAFSGSKRVGPYISDQTLVDRILLELDAAEEPTFIMAITMSTHGPFDYEPDPEVLVKVEGGLSPLASKALGNFANAIAHADVAFENLIRALENRDRPVLVVLFGDHLPPLQAQGVYEETGFTKNLKELGMSYAERMNRVPLLFWANYPLEKEDLSLSSNYLLPQILRRAGIPLDSYHRFVEATSQRIPVLSTTEIRAAEGSIHKLEQLRRDEGELGQLVSDYELMIWDRLFGKLYSDQKSGDEDSDAGAMSLIE